MKSLLRFLLFVAFVGMAVTLLYFWKQGKIATTEAAPVPAAQMALPSLTALDAEFTALVNHVLPSVVSINATSEAVVDPRLQLLRLLQGTAGTDPNLDMGSGVIVSPDGHIVTNLHVISRAAKVEVTLSDGRMLPAKFVGADPLSDIAIVKIEADGLPPLPFGDSDKVNVGQMVFAVGNPLGLQETVTQGIISAKGRRSNSEAANEVFQTDAAINQGNSGGPLISLRGEIIGINNAISPQGQGIGFAIPSNTVRRVFEGIRDNGRFIRPWFGAYMRSLTPKLAQQLGLPDAAGALVLMTYKGSPAERSGLLPGDVITEYDGRVIRDLIDLRNRVAESSIGRNVAMQVWRKGKALSLEATIGAEPGA